MAETLRLANAGQVREAVAWALAAKEPLEIVGGGSKPGLGRPVSARHRLDVGHLAAIDSYEPEELVLTAGAGARLRDIRELLAERDQELAFEPPDLAPLLGGAPDSATIGGVLACNLSGPRRIKAGAARDHFLGVKGVSGRGEAFKSGGRVVKNVTGYDMAKLLAGSHGTLAVLTEVSVRVLPAAEMVHTLLLLGLDDGAAVAALGRAARTPFEPSGLAHLPAAMAAQSLVADVATHTAAVTAIRIEGPRQSVADRAQSLAREFGDLPSASLDREASRALWAEIRDVAAFAAWPDRVVWRLSVPPAAGAETVARITADLGCTALYDWAGGLIWLALDAGIEAGAETVRAGLGGLGGHALLVRARADVRRRVPVFQPQAPALAALSARIKDGFDPQRILNPGRMYEGV